MGIHWNLPNILIAEPLWFTQLDTQKCVATSVHWPVSQTFTKIAMQKFFVCWIRNAEIYICSHHIVSRHCLDFDEMCNIERVSTSIHSNVYMLPRARAHTLTPLTRHLMAKLLQFQHFFLHLVLHEWGANNILKIDINRIY